MSVFFSLKNDTFLTIMYALNGLNQERRSLFHLISWYIRTYCQPIRIFEDEVILYLSLRWKGRLVLSKICFCQITCSLFSITKRKTLQETSLRLKTFPFELFICLNAIRDISVYNNGQYSETTRYLFWTGIAIFPSNLIIKLNLC